MEFINKFLENKYTYAPWLGLLLCVINPVGFFSILGSTTPGWGWLVFGLAMVLTLGLYILVGMRPALRWARNLAHWGWVVVPFPYDLITFPVVFFVSLFCLILLPFFPVWKACREAKAARKA